jgi:hypothetical protein
MNEIVKVSFSVKLSNRMFAFFHMFAAICYHSDNDAELGNTGEVLGEMSDQDLFGLVDKFDSDQHKIEGPHNRAEFDAEFAALLEVWGPDYDIEHLVQASEEGLSTHCLASEIETGQGFEIDGPEGKGDHGVRRQWERVKIAGQKNDLLDGKVPARVTYGYINDGNVELIDPNQVVRPHFQGRTTCSSVGSCLRTPNEVRECKQRWKDCQEAIAELHLRVEEAITGKTFVSYSAYDSDERDVPIDNLDEVAIEGDAVLWGDGYTDKRYRSKVVKNPTWLALCVLANAMIKRTGDHHHVFLEGVHLDEEATAKRHDGVKIYRFSMGS